MTDMASSSFDPLRKFKMNSGKVTLDSSKQGEEGGKAVCFFAKVIHWTIIFSYADKFTEKVDSQCGILVNFLSLAFYVKLILVN